MAILGLEVALVAAAQELVGVAVEVVAGGRGDRHDRGVRDRPLDLLAGEPVVVAQAELADQALEVDVVLDVERPARRVDVEDVVVEAQAVGVAHPGLADDDVLARSPGRC